MEGYAWVSAESAERVKRLTAFDQAFLEYVLFGVPKRFSLISFRYCENGSLHNIIKRFGKFPENLVAVYISQVLEGLVYLHEQGVIHRDIKG